MKKKLNPLHVIFAIAIVIVYPTIIIPYIIAAIAYYFVFQPRVKKLTKAQDSSCFENMIERKVTFKSSGHNIAGSFYYDKDKYTNKGIVIVSHGIGCAKDNYINRSNYFIKKGYLVFAFDMTGCVGSEGKTMRGLPQAIIDLNNAIKYIDSLDELKDLKLLVYGHSWSGYASSCVLNNDDACKRITGLATLAGFNDSWEIIRVQGANFAGKAIALLKPFIMLHQYFLFGKYAFYKGIKGVSNYDGPVLVEHSTDDPTVPYSISVACHKDECTNKKATFKVYNDRAHTLSRPVKYEKLICESLEGNQTKSKQNGRNIFQYTVDVHYEHSKDEWIYAIDEEYMDHVNEFFEKCLEESNVK